MSYGHFLAFMSVFFWSALYVCVKVLLEEFSALELLFMQFVLGYVFLLLLKPKILKIPLKQELWFMLSGLCGITIYNLFLNLALEKTYASNVSVIIATAPLFSAIFAFSAKIEKPYKNFFIGFVFCIVGIYLLSFGGSAFSFSPLGDILALISAMGWGAYAIFILKITKMDYDLILSTRKIIFYGIIFMMPAFLFLDFSPNLNALLKPKILFNLLFVALFASGICFILFNKATLLIGAIKTNIYVYLTPIITIIASLIVLDENLSLTAFIGSTITLLGVVISERR